MRRTSFVLLAFLALAVAPAAAQSTEMSGYLEVAGCSPAPNQIHLKALPVRPVGDKSELLPTNMGVGVARLSPKTEGAYPFTFTGLDPKKAYRLGINLTAKGCGKVAWKGPSFVFPGQTGIRVTGLGIRTQVEIATLDAAGGETWVGARTLNLLDPAAATVKVRLYSDRPDIKAFTLQFSSERFTTDLLHLADGCGTPQMLGTPGDSPTDRPGLLGTLTVPATGPGWTETNVDFNDAVMGSLSRLAAAAAAEAGAGGLVGPPGVFDDEDRDGTIDQPALTRQQVLIGVTQRLIEMGAPVYVRVVPQFAAQETCHPESDGVGGWAVIANNGPIYNGPSLTGTTSVQIDRYVYNPPKVREWPSGGDTCYRLTQDYTFTSSLYELHEGMTAADWNYNFLAHAGGGVPLGAHWVAGQHFCISPPDGLDAAVQDGIDLVSGALDAIGFLVTSASKIFDAVKGAVVNVLADVVTAVGVDCDSTCRAALEGGIDIALAAAGLPPSLPNWDELKAQGIDYVAGVIADQAGIPPEVAERALEYANEAVSQLDSQRGGDGSSLPTWLQIDVGFEPASMVYTLSQLGDPTILGMKRRMTTIGSESLLGAETPLPSNFGTITVPVVLRPNLEGLPPVPTVYGIKMFSDAMWTKISWVKRWVNGTCVPLSTAIREKPWLSTGYPTVSAYYISVPLWTNVIWEGPLIPDGVYSTCGYQ